VDVPSHVPGVTKCCEHPKHSNCDSKGIQMSLCMKNGFQKKTHDALNLEIQSMISVAGISSKREQKDMFRISNPECGMRGDLTVFECPQSTSNGKHDGHTYLPVQSDSSDNRIKVLITDLSVVSAVRGPNCQVALSDNDALESNRAANAAYYNKNKKYSDECAKNGIKFLPLIVETSGKHHPVFDNFFNIILNTMNTGMHPEYSSISKFYWASRLSCCLQKSIAYAVRRKYSISNGKAVRGLHFSHTNRANIIDRDLTLQCDNTVGEFCLD